MPNSILQVLEQEECLSKQNCIGLVYSRLQSTPNNVGKYFDDFSVLIDR